MYHSQGIAMKEINEGVGETAICKDKKTCLSFVAGYNT